MTLNKAGNMDICGYTSKKGHINTNTQRHKQNKKQKNTRHKKLRTQGIKTQEIKDTKGQRQLKKIIRKYIKTQKKEQVEKVIGLTLQGFKYVLVQCKMSALRTI